LADREARRERRRPKAEKEAPFVDFLQPLSPGPRIKIASALHRAGISSWDGIAAMSEEELIRIMAPSRVAEALSARLHEYATSRTALVTHGEEA
jgi:predicted flap endonuclease-1-like 5' DNA nuclease